ncbi:hypothetical protein OESDEN_11058 [Oesophagostomum dentatum]|uniref:ET module n=1 Tax=Oesophagostomum dentatum TaxID=61180 RepID=A0A0B1SZ18_OESDE|nr:hypothetical protein OESDEN_11058 [Oesophagostomum dentatum]
MVSVRCAFLLLAIFAVGYSIKCYSQSTANSDKPTASVDCPVSFTYCEKKAVTSGSNTANSYNCGSNADCSASGCTKTGGITTCCCKDKDLCNGSSNLSAFFALVPIAIARLLLC